MEKQAVIITREERLTTEYRQKACLLAAVTAAAAATTSLGASASSSSTPSHSTQSNSMIQQTVVQHMMVHHPGYIPLQLLQQNAAGIRGDNENATANATTSPNGTQPEPNHPPAAKEPHGGDDPPAGRKDDDDDDANTDVVADLGAETGGPLEEEIDGPRPRSRITRERQGLDASCNPPATETTELVSSRPATAVTSTTTQNTPIQSTETAIVHVHLPCCTHCGGPLQPGYQGTTVRLHSIHLSRTQRRRAARLRAKQLVVNRKKSGGTRTKAAAAPVFSKLLEFCQQEQRSASADRIPTECRNYLQVKCGVCRAAFKVPGILRTKNALLSSTNNSNAAEEKQSRSTNPMAMVRKSVAASNAAMAAAAAASARADANTIDAGADFLALEPSKKNNKTAVVQTARKPPPPPPKRPPPATLFDQRKKKKKPKSNQMLDFLSSFNDP